MRLDRRWQLVAILATLLTCIAVLVRRGPPTDMTTLDRVVLEDLESAPRESLDGLVHGPEGLALAAGRSQGTYLSPVRTAPFAFDELVTSWNARASAGGRLRVEVRVGGDTGLSCWLHVATWNDPATDPGPRQQGDETARLVEDTVLAHNASRYQLRITIDAGKTGKGPSLSLLASTLSGPATAPADAEPSLSPADPAWPPGPQDRIGPSGRTSGASASSSLAPARGRVLDVPFRSQRWESADIRSRICAPTSLAMVLAFHGTPLPTAEVASGCYDLRNDIYGNWSLDAAFAGAMGYQAIVARARSLDPVEEEIARGRPVILSLRFGKGELDGAPVEQTTGHLLVVRGFTAGGDVVVNDPAGDSAARGQRTYRRDELLRAWKSGVAILVRPRS